MNTSLAEKVEQFPKREKLILAGLYLATFDKAGLELLGFDSFTEAFNILGFAMGGRPASVKNYRDEFDPFFPNPRRGWHKRELRPHCKKVMDHFKSADMDTFASLIRSFACFDANKWSELKPDDGDQHKDSSFAKRLMTGLAAEHYFEHIHATLPQFKCHKIENTTQHGCGYDFRLHSGDDRGFLAVEVKGLQDRTGNLSMTPKEYEQADALSDRFYLFVVKNFRETPCHEIYQNPLSSGLHFSRKERLLIHVSWSATI